MNLALSVSRLTERYGAPHTIRKGNAATGANAWTNGAETPSYIACRARERGYRPHEIRGGIQENDALIVVDANSLPAGASPPEKGDRIAEGVIAADNGTEWRTIVNVHAVRDGGRSAGEIITYRLQVRA